MGKVEKLKIEYKFNEKKIELLNKKVDILYKVILIFIVGIITLNMNNYYFQENNNMQKLNEAEKILDFELIRKYKDSNKVEIMKPDINLEELNTYIKELEIISKEFKEFILENKKINEYIIDFFEWQFYLISLFIIILMRYYIQIILIGRKNEFLRKKIVENIPKIYYKNKRV